MKVAIIGSGVSGLIAGAYLAQAGHQVTIFEQYHQAGGVTAPLERDGYNWDLGQLLVEGFGPGEPTGIVLEELGLTDKVPIIIDDRGYVFPDFEIRKPGVYAGIKWRIDKLKSLFPEELNGLDEYWGDYTRFISIMTLARRIERSSGLNSLYLKGKLYTKLIPMLSKKDWNAQQLMDHYFDSEKLKCVFISILADFFTPPSQFMGLGVFALNPETSFDRRMPKILEKDAEQLHFYSILDGISSLVDALVDKIKSHGGQIFTSRPVAKIQVENGRVSGVVDSEHNYTPADLVIASGGAKETFFKLVGEDNLPAEFTRTVAEIPLMDSVFMVHLGINFDPSTYVHGVCTYYYGTYDIEGGIDEAKEGIYHEGKDGFVVHVPTLHSPGMAPDGHHAVTVYTICPDALKAGDWGTLKEDYANKLVAQAEKYIPGLAEHTQVRVILTPEDFRKRTHLDHHAFGGLAPLMGKSRIPHRTPIEGLWFVGAQSESGGGVNAVIPAAYKTAKASIRRS
jgi:phytoene dehydrogenase-like protein